MNKLEQAAWLALDVLENERCHVSANWDNIVKAITALREALSGDNVSPIEQAEQEPIHIENIYKSGDKYFAWIGDDYVQIYTAPVQQVELTDDEIISALGADMDTDEDKEWFMEIARLGIAADREKNK